MEGPQVRSVTLSLEEQLAAPAQLPGSLLDSFGLLGSKEQKWTRRPEALVTFTRQGWSSGGLYESGKGHLVLPCPLPG